LSYDRPGRRGAASPPAPDPDAVEATAQLLAASRRPLVITASAGRDAAAVAALAEFAERFALPVVEHRQRYLCLPGDHPCHLGYDPTPYLEAADTILVVECDVPWTPSRKAPGPHCKVIHVGIDPLFARYPIRGYPSDIALTAAPRLALPQLGEALARLDPAGLEERRRWLDEKREELRAGWRKTRDAAAAERPISPAWVSACLAAVKGDDAILVNEYTLLNEHCRSLLPGSYFGSSPAAGLGWGAGAAVGAKLAAPERPVIAILGDGSYIFSNPVAVHHAAATHRLPVLFVVVNNAMWGAVRRATLGMYPGGEAARSNKPPFIYLDDLPAFEQVCAAAGGHGERVEDPAELPAALARAMTAVTVEGRQALVNVICRGV
jgi:acetolactate synthase-1/2/3 large subunit